MWSQFESILGRAATRAAGTSRSASITAPLRSRYQLGAASGFALVAAIGGVAAADDGKIGYLYKPPQRLAKPEAAEPSAPEADAPIIPVKTVAHAPKPRVLFVLGGPGAGKGTQCGKLVKEYGFVHLSAGDLLRDERDSGSADGEMIENYIREGKIVPVEVTVNLIKKAMARSGATKFLVDGFPRNHNNLDGWNTVMGSEAEVDGVLFYEVSEDVLVSRLLKRAETSGRSDDNIDTILKRLRVYNDSTVPVVDHYAKQGKVTRIFGGDPIEEVFKVTSAAVEPVIAKEVLGYSQLLLDSISFGDFDAYQSLVSDDVTCFEEEASSLGRIVGTDFHKAFFAQGSKARQEASKAGKEPSVSVSTMSDAQVRLLGPKHALVTYTRLISPVGATQFQQISKVSESRVWKLVDGKSWKMVHFHRSKQE